MTDPIRTPDAGPPRGPHPRAEPTRVVSSGDAKQGRKGMRVFTILMVSLVLLIVATGILLTWQQVALRDEPPARTGSPTTRSPVTQPPAANSTQPPGQTSPATR